MLCAGNLAVTFSATMASHLALTAPCRMTQRRAREMLPEQVDMLIEKDDAYYLLFDASEKLEVRICASYQANAKVACPVML